MLGAIALSGTSRRFSRPSTSAVSSGASISTLSTRCFFVTDSIDWSGPGAPVLPGGAKTEAERFAGPVAAARNHGEGIAADRELSRPFRERPLGVAEIVEPIDHLRLGDALVAPDGERAREDARVGALELAVHARVDHAREAHVEIRDDGKADDRRHADADGDVELPAPLAQERESRAGRRLRGRFRRTGDGHLDDCAMIVY
jgi:hypothetical protein